ncbi:hypothetical protein [Clostridium estertheticum]|nr:hypothetical protein [Clostridium estertheticum]
MAHGKQVLSIRVLERGVKWSMMDTVDIVTKDIITSDSIQFKGAMLD